MIVVEGGIRFRRSHSRKVAMVRDSMAPVASSPNPYRPLALDDRSQYSYYYHYIYKEERSPMYKLNRLWRTPESKFLKSLNITKINIRRVW